jgi:hypothetical protein
MMTVGRLGLVALLLAAPGYGGYGEVARTDIEVDCTVRPGRGWNPRGPGSAFTSIGAALQHAGPGPTRLLVAGRCEEVVHIAGRTLLAIEAKAPGATIAAPAASGPVLEIVSSAGISIAGMTIEGAPVLLNRSELTLVRTTLERNTVVRALDDSTVRLDTSVLQDGSAGVVIQGGSLTVIDSTIRRNAGPGISAVGAQVTLTHRSGNNVIEENGGAGLALGLGAGAVIGAIPGPGGPRITVFRANQAGIRANQGGAFNLSGPHQITNNELEGIRVGSVSHAQMGGGVVVSGTIGNGINILDNASVFLGDTQVSGSTGAGIHAFNGAVVHFGGNVIVGNGGKAVECDASVIIRGNLAGIDTTYCSNTQ